MTRDELIAGVVANHESRPGWCYGRKLIEDRIDRGLVIGERVAFFKGHVTYLGGSEILVEYRNGGSRTKIVDQQMLDTLLMWAAYRHSKGSTLDSSGMAQPFFMTLGRAHAT